MPMSRTLSRSCLALLLASSLLACGRPQGDKQQEARVVEDPTELEAEPASAAEQRRKLGRGTSSMPETFAGFPRPELESLDGVWVIDGNAPSRAIVWVVEDDGTALTTIDRHGREQLHGITLSSPCALRLTDENGRAYSRAIAQTKDRLIVSSKGAIAVAAADGALLACAGHRTYQIAADGRCRYTTEMLGTWSDPVEAKDACTIEQDDGARVLVLAGQRLREQADGLWLDEVAAADVAVRMSDRAVAIAALTPEPVAAAAASAGETGEPEPADESD